MVPTVPRAMLFSSRPTLPAPTLHAPRQTSGVEWCADPPAGYCLPPTAQLPKIEGGPISTSGSLFQYVTEPGDFYGQNHQRADKELKAPPALRGSAMVARPTRPQIFAVN